MENEQIEWLRANLSIEIETTVECCPDLQGIVVRLLLEGHEIASDYAS